jgi:MFS family permease
VDRTGELRSNVRHLYADVFWFGILAGSAIGFVSIYAARLGASGMQIGWLTAGPALVNLCFSLPAGQWLTGRPLMRVAYWSAFWQRLGYLALIFWPWLLPGAVQVTTIIWLTLLMSLPGTVLAISFNAMLAEALPVEWRAEVVGRRNALLAISTTLSYLVSGQILDWLVFPFNYQVVFALGAAGGILSTYHLGRLRPAAAGGSPPANSPATRRRLDLSLLRGAFGRFTLAYLVFYTFQYLCLPLFPLAYVNSLQLTDGMISLGNALFYLTMMLVSLRLGWLANRFGHRRLLAFSAPLLSVYALLIGLARGAFLFWVASLVGGVIYGILSASLINRLMERVPADQRPAGMAFHNLALNLGTLAGSLSGPLLGEAVGVQPAILIGAGLRLLAGLLIILWG